MISKWARNVPGASVPPEAEDMGSIGGLIELVMSPLSHTPLLREHPVQLAGESAW